MTEHVPGDEVSLGIRISGDDLAPDEITRLLGVPPTLARRRGDQLPGAGGRRIQRTGIWLLDLPASGDWALEDGIRTLLGRLPDDVELWRALAARHRVDLVCGAILAGWNRGFVLPAAVLHELSRRSISLDVDIYRAEEDPRDG